MAESQVSQFYQGVQADYGDVVDTVEGASYVSWPTVIARSGRPPQRVVEFGDQRQYLEVFGGAIVAVDTTTAEGVVRRAYLPVLNAKNQPVPAERLTVRDLNDSLNRCRARSIAMATGHSLSLYAKGMSAAAFVEELNVYPDDDLSMIKPKTMKKADKSGKVKSTYLGWPDAVAAASITDPSFVWEVLFFEHIDQQTGEVRSLPYRKGPGGGFIVSVRVVYRGVEHIEHLPIMGIAEVQTRNGAKPMEHQPNLNPTAADWNASVVRCLAKAIAVRTGYGLSIYAGEDIDLLIAGGVFLDQQPAQASATATPKAAETPQAKVAKPAEDEPKGSPEGETDRLLAETMALMAETETAETKLQEFFNFTVPIDQVPRGLLLKIHEGLVAKRRRRQSQEAKAT